jgi:hypothetical protein
MWTLKLHAAWRTPSKSKQCYDNLDALLERKDIDAVVIASPSKFHLCAVQTAAASGKHIFCEKLLAVTIEDVDAAIAAAERPRFCCRGLHAAIRIRPQRMPIAGSKQAKLEPRLFLDRLAATASHAPISFYQSSRGWVVPGFQHSLV